MSLKQSLQDDMKSALRSRDADTLSVIRMALAAVKQYEVDNRADADDAVVLGILTKMVKQRKDSVRLYEEGGRHDLAEKEAAEIVKLQHYLPSLMDAAQIESAVRDAVHATGAASAADTGKVMGVLKQQLAGRADMAEVSKILRSVLAAL